MFYFQGFSCLYLFIYLFGFCLVWFWVFCCCYFWVCFCFLFCFKLFSIVARVKKKIKISITIHENISSSHGTTVYKNKTAFPHSHKIKNIAKLKCVVFMWKYMTDYDSLFIFVSERHFNLQGELL